MKIAIQGELGSNSHMAALAMVSVPNGLPEIVPCAISAQVFEHVLSGAVEGAVLPIENSLHGSVAEHYDLLLAHPVRIIRESLLRIRHHLIAAPGVGFEEITRVISHPVALAQCRHFLDQHPEWQVVPFYDTAGSVKHVLEANLRDTAGIAPTLAAEQYGGAVLREGVEDHASNFTRFHLVVRDTSPRADQSVDANKMSLAFTIEHRPGTLVLALERLHGAGVDLTKIESRPVPGSLWEYVFYVDVRLPSKQSADAAVQALRGHCRMVKELGRYVAA